MIAYNPCPHKSLMANVKNMSSKRVLLTICFLVFSFFVMQFSVVVYAVSDSIFQGQVITHPETLVSLGKIFVLGFFSAGNTSNFYLGIWYYEGSEKTVVWVGNRDHPFTGTSPKLTISDDGNLVILDGRITYRLSDNLLGHNTSAVLLDSGNFILRDENFDILWQSFDSPTDSFLPGMKLGYSRKTGKEWSFTSWKDSEDPNLGVVKFTMDPKLNQIFLMRGSQMFWTSGVWNEDHFVLAPEMLFDNIFNYTFHSDDDETYLTYSVRNGTFLSRYLVGFDGQVKRMNYLKSRSSWFMFWAQPRDCPLLPGPFSSCSQEQCICECLHGFIPSDKWARKDISGGCLRRTPLWCEYNTSFNGDKDGFLRMDDVSFPLGPKVTNGGNAKECKLACLNNCSCTAYAYNRSEVCSLWYGELSDLTQLSKSDPNGQTIYIKLAASELPKHGGKKKRPWILVIVVVLALPASYIFIKWRRKIKEKEQRGQDMLLFDINMIMDGGTNELSDGDKSGKGKSNDAWLPLFSFASVSAATDNFSTENKLGQGGFGPVYKGKLLNGQEVAVKRLSKQSRQGFEELKNETILIAKLQHRNLVRILGCCIERGEQILIYEYMPNKSLDSFLFDPTKKGLLGWEIRVKIIEGIAQGILYLHQYSRLRIIHRDLKASNILLDTDMNPKISDFGMARMFGGDELQANTNRIVGTYGYMSPEYAMEGLFSIKSDVFSFGVLLLEIVSGKKNTGLYQTESLYLLGHAWHLWKDDRALNLMDPVLENEASYSMLMRYINVSLLCVQENAADRPTMSEVVSMLTNEHIDLPSPKQPAFSHVRSVQNSNPPASRVEACSVNSVTISLMEGR